MAAFWKILFKNERFAVNDLNIETSQYAVVFYFEKLWGKTSF